MTRKHVETNRHVGSRRLTATVLVAHRVPPQLLGIVPTNAGGFGKVSEAADSFFVLEILPIMRDLEAIIDWLGVEAVAWVERQPLAAKSVA